MDQRLRDFERQAKEGDLQAAYQWFTLLGRSRPNDYEAILESMKLIGDLQYPGLMAQIAQIDKMVDAIKIHEVDVAPPEWTTEITTTNNTGR